MKRPVLDPALVSALKKLKLGYIAEALPERLVLADKQNLSFESLLLQLSDHGHALLARSPNGLSQEDLHRIKRVREEAASDNPHEPSQVAAEALPDPADERTPDERLRQAYEEIRQTQRLDLLRAVRSVSPTRFEAIVLDVLHTLGYGQTRKHLQKTGAGADGGIDGIISLDRLGLEKVYIQVKRYAEDNPVSRPAIQAFLGALSERRASKGVFITTSRFSREARDCAARASDSLVLLDGDELAAIMLDYKVGVSVRETLTLVSVDSDYFEDDYDTLG